MIKQFFVYSCGSLHRGIYHKMTTKAPVSKSSIHKQQIYNKNIGAKELITYKNLEYTEEWTLKFRPNF